MKQKYGIGIFILSLLIACMLSYTLYCQGNEKEEEDLQESITFTEGYYLYERNGYVVVYLGDKITPYEYTDIRYDELPKSEQQQIENGKYIKNIDELYGFLENYTS